MELDKLMKVVNESYEKNANVKIVFGDPVTKEGITIIPIAKLSAKAGEGNSFNIRFNSPEYAQKIKKEDPTAEPIEKKIEKMGYGIDSKITPMGYIEIKGGKAEFKPILDLNRIIMMGICFVGFSVFMGTRMFTQVARIYSKSQHKCDGKDKEGKESCCCDSKKEK